MRQCEVDMKKKVSLNNVRYDKIVTIDQLDDKVFSTTFCR